MQQIKWRLHVPAETASPLEPRCGDAEVIPCPQEDPLFLPKKISMVWFKGNSTENWPDGGSQVPAKKSPSNEKQIIGQSK